MFPRCFIPGQFSSVRLYLHACVRCLLPWIRNVTSHTSKKQATKGSPIHIHKTTAQYVQQGPSQDEIVAKPVLPRGASNTQVGNNDANAEDRNEATQESYYGGTLDDDSIISLNSSGSVNESGVCDCSTSTTTSCKSSRACGPISRPISCILTYNNSSEVPGHPWKDGRCGHQTSKNRARCLPPHDGHATESTPPDNLDQPRQKLTKSQKLRPIQPQLARVPTPLLW